VGFVGVLDGNEFCDAGVNEEDVDLAEFLRNRRIEAVEVGKFRDVGLNGKDSVADRLDCLVECFLATSGNRDLGAFFRKALGAARPMPLLPPVMTATLPSKRFIHASMRDAPKRKYEPELNAPVAGDFDT